MIERVRGIERGLLLFLGKIYIEKTRRMIEFVGFFRAIILAIIDKVFIVAKGK